jgi:hypothetical protein
MPVHPVIVFTPWHRGCLSECNPLGQGSHSFNIGIEFWKWRWAVIIGRTDNVKTQVEIDRETEVKP